MTEMNIKTRTYYIGNNFYIDIVDILLTDFYEAWIWNEEYGIKELMFAMPTEQQTYNEFVEIVRKNAYEYMNTFVDDNFNDDERRKFYAKNNIMES